MENFIKYFHIFKTIAGVETENDSSSEDELMRRSRLNTGASVASAVSATSALSAASGSSALSGGSSHSSLNASVGGAAISSNAGKIIVGNNCSVVGRDSFNKKPR